MGNNQVSIFGNLIKEDVWSLTLDKTKGNKDLYYQSINPDLEKKLTDIPDRKKVKAFKRNFLAFIFDPNIGRGIHQQMTIEQIYEYEYKDSNMGGRGIVICKITDDFIEVSHRFGPDKYYEKFNSIDELRSAMLSLDDVKDLDRDLDSYSDDSIWSICRMLYQVHNNFDSDNKSISAYLNDFSDRCRAEIRKRELKLASELSEPEYLTILSDYIYRTIGIKMQRIIDNESKNTAVSELKKHYNSYGCSFIYCTFIIGSLNCSTKGAVIDTRDKRQFSFSWSQVYDTINKKNQPKQLDILSLITA